MLTSSHKCTPAAHTQPREHSRRKTRCQLHTAPSALCYRLLYEHASSFPLTTNQLAGAPRTRLHPVWHAIPTQPANPVSTHPNPVPCPRASTATTALLLDEECTDLRHRSRAAASASKTESLSRGRSRVDWTPETLLSMTKCSAGHDDRRAALRDELACDDGAASSALSSSSLFSAYQSLPKTYLCNKDNILIIKNRSF